MEEQDRRGVGRGGKNQDKEDQRERKRERGPRSIHDSFCLAAVGLRTVVPKDMHSGMHSGIWCGDVVVSIE